MEQFQDTFIPGFLVAINAALVPPVELIVGLLITIGLLTRAALAACLLLMLVLMYGVTLLQNWSTASSQLIYDIILALLLAGVGYNVVSIDRWLSRNGRRPTEAVQSATDSTMEFAANWMRRSRSFRSLRRR